MVVHGKTRIGVHTRPVWAFTLGRNMQNALIKYFEINLTPLGTENVSEDLSTQFNYGSLLEELISEFYM